MRNKKKRDEISVPSKTGNLPTEPCPGMTQTIDNFYSFKNMLYINDDINNVRYLNVIYCKKS